jgi:hypothetical protein
MGPRIRNPKIRKDLKSGHFFFFKQCIMWVHKIQEAKKKKKRKETKLKFMNRSTLQDMFKNEEYLLLGYDAV